MPGRAEYGGAAPTAHFPAEQLSGDPPCALRIAAGIKQPAAARRVRAAYGDRLTGGHQRVDPVVELILAARVEDDAVNVAAQQKCLQRLALRLRVIQDRIHIFERQAIIKQLRLRALKAALHVGEIQIRKSGIDDRDADMAAAAQGACRPVRHVVQILRGAEDRLAVFVADRQIAAHDLLDRPKRKA